MGILLSGVYRVRQLVEEEMTVEEGDILRVGQSELKISIKKIPNA